MRAVPAIRRLLCVRAHGDQRRVATEAIPSSRGGWWGCGGNGIPLVQRGVGMLIGQRKAKCSGSEDTEQSFQEEASPQLDPGGLK